MTDEKNNTGYRNTGNRNAGDYNTGDWNTGDWNTGHCNAGHYNAGDWNTGHYNTGDWNTGGRNTGYRNTGGWNAGNYNTGNRNTGNWNSTNKETGFFNTTQSDTVRVFNKPCNRKEWESANKPYLLYFDLVQWIPGGEMTDQEKFNNPTYKTTGGYLKTFDYKEAFQKSWNNASKEDREKVKALPNFDADVFYEISGIRVDEPSCAGKVVEIDGKKYKLTEV